MVVRWLKTQLGTTGGDFYISFDYVPKGVS